MKNDKTLAYIFADSSFQKSRYIISKLAKSNNENNLGIHFLIISFQGGEHKHITEFMGRFAIEYDHIHPNIPGTQKGLLFKAALEHAKENDFKYLLQIGDVAIDNIESALTYIEKRTYTDYSLSVAPRIPPSLNPGKIFNLLVNILSSLSLKKKIIDTRGDSINIYRVKDFTSFLSKKIQALSNDYWFFRELLSVCSYHRLPINYLSPEALKTKGSVISINRNWFLKSLKIIFLEIFNLKLTRAEKTQATKTTNKEEKNPLRLDHLDPSNKDVVVVNWCLTNICNFKCSYCPESLHNGTNKGIGLEDIKRFFFKVKEDHPEKTLFFEFTGGEVTYYKEFPELIRFIKENGGHVGIISNGSRKLDFWEKHHEYLDHICLSFHSEQGKADHFFDVTSFLCQHVRTHVNIMMKPESFKSSKELANRIAKKCQASVAMQPLLEEMDGKLFNYTPEQKADLDSQKLSFSNDPEFKFKKGDSNSYIFRGPLKLTLRDGSSQTFNTPDLISKDMNQWSGWKCYAGIENIVVDMEGNILRGWCNVGGSCGNVKDKSIKLFQKPIICNKKYCNCGQDIMCTKVQI